MDCRSYLTGAHRSVIWSRSISCNASASWEAPAYSQVQKIQMKSKEEIHTKSFRRWEKKNVILNCVSGRITLTHIGITPDSGLCQVNKLIFFFFLSNPSRGFKLNRRNMELLSHNWFVSRKSNRRLSGCHSVQSDRDRVAEKRVISGV